MLLAPSDARSQSKRPFKKRRFEPCRPIPGHFERRKRPIRDQWSAFNSLIRWRRISKETPRKSCPTITSGSALCSVTEVSELARRPVKPRDITNPRDCLGASARCSSARLGLSRWPSLLLQSQEEIAPVVEQGYVLCMVTLPVVLGRRVGLKVTAMSLELRKKLYPLFDQILAVAHTISRMFS